MGLECLCRLSNLAADWLVALESWVAGLSVCELDSDDAVGGSGVMHGLLGVQR